MKKILIVGAGFLQRFVIRRAKELGYYVLTVDGNPNAVGFSYADEYAVIDIVDKESCLQYAKNKKIDGVMTAATDYPIVTVAYIADKLQLPGISMETAQLVKNKYLVKKRLIEKNVDDSKQVFQIMRSEDMKAVREQVEYPSMIKPCDGSGSRGVNCCTHKEMFEDMCQSALNNSKSGKVLIESYIEGKEYGVESFVYKGKVYVQAVMKKKMTAAPYYAELGHVLDENMESQLEEKIRTCAEKAIQALGITFGAVNMDMLVTEEDAVHIVDIGARMGGNLIGSHIVPLGTGMDYMGNLIKISVGDEPSFEKEKHCACVATKILALTEGIIKGVPDFEKIAEENQVIIEAHIEKGDVIHSYQTNLDGCGYVVVCDSEATKAEERAEKIKILIDEEIVRES